MAANLFDLLFRALLALGLGGLIGIDRERVHKGYPAGIRTLAFISLLGMLASFISDSLNNPMIIPVSIGLVFLLIIVGYGVSVVSSMKRFGLTSTIIMLITYLIGLISYYEEFQYLAVAVAIITTLALTERKILHDFARKMKTEELLDALRFGIVAFVILPLLPNEYVDPFGVINPYNLWLMVVLILGISFLGYVAAKLVGSRKGLYWSGLVGGLVSSTAVSSSMSITSRKHSNLTDACAVGITLASSIMFLRVFVEAYIVNNALGLIMVIPLLSTALLGLITSYLTRTKKEAKSEQIIQNSPFNFIPAVKFTILLAVIILASKLASDLIGSTGAYVTSIFAGLIDTDAITLSIASLSGTEITVNTGKNAVLIACLTNTIVKLFIIKTTGNKELFNKVLRNYIIMIIPIIIFILLTF